MGRNKGVFNSLGHIAGAAGRGTKTPNYGRSGSEMAPLRFRIIHKRFGIGPESPGPENPNSETGSLETPPTSEESANHRFLSGGARLGLDESAGYAGTRPTPLSRALIRLRKAGLTQHVENCGTNSSNPPLSSKESANHRFPRARQIDRRSDEASKPKPYLRAVLQVRIHLPPAESPVNSAPAGEKDE